MVNAIIDTLFVFARSLNKEDKNNSREVVMMATKSMRKNMLFEANFNLSHEVLN